jgi:predicted N-acyltransferase
MTARRRSPGTLNLVGKDTLYGRYWGATRNVPFLHFELCYYQAVDYAIEHGLRTVEAGAQGEHKLARGYEPATTRSIHWIGHPGLRHAVANFVEQEKAAVLRRSRVARWPTPFRKAAAPGVDRKAPPWHERASGYAQYTARRIDALRARRKTNAMRS